MKWVKDRVTKMLGIEQHEVGVVNYGTEAAFEHASYMRIEGAKFRMFTIKPKENDVFFLGTINDINPEALQEVSSNQPIHVKIFFDDFVRGELALLSMDAQNYTGIDDLYSILKNKVAMFSLFKFGAEVQFGTDRREVMRRPVRDFGIFHARPLGSNHFQEATEVLKVLSAPTGGVIVDGDDSYPVASGDTLLFSTATKKVVVFPPSLTDRVNFVACEPPLVPKLSGGSFVASMGVDAREDNEVVLGVGSMYT
jgi:hypothetical protein